MIRFYSARSFFTLLSIVLFCSCATQESAYLPLNKEGRGFMIQEHKTNLYTALFHSDQNTSLQRGKAFSRLAALEFCFNKNQYARLAQTYTRTTKAKKSQTFLTKFRCLKSHRSLKGSHSFRESPQGLSVLKAPHLSALRPGDFLTHCEGSTLFKRSDLKDCLSSLPQNKNSVNLIYKRNKRRHQVQVLFKDHSEKLVTHNLKQIEEACAQRTKFDPKIPFCNKIKETEEQIKKANDRFLKESRKKAIK